MKNIILFLFYFFFSLSISAQTVTTFAGSCNELDHGLVNGNGSTARFYNPRAIAIDGSGNFYVADSGNNCIRKITPNGHVTTLAGSTSNYPSGVAVDTTGNVYISDTNNNRILKINAGSTTPYTLAGSITAGNADGIGIAAQFNTPAGIAVDLSGNVFVADSNNHRIRKINPSGLVTTFAGSSPGNTNGMGVAAQFNSPFCLAIDASGTIFVSDRNNNQIKKITPNGMVSTYIGNGDSGNVDGTGPTVSLNQPLGLTIDSNNTIYVISGNNTIRKITPDGAVSIFVGNANLNWGGCLNGEGTTAEFLFPVGIVINTSGNLYIADSGNNTIRKVAVYLTTNDFKLEDQIKLSPNPTTNTITIHIDNFTTAKTTIFDMNGRILQTDNITENNTPINISGLSKGIYLLQVMTDNGSLSKKIVKD